MLKQFKESPFRVCRKSGRIVGLNPESFWARLLFPLLGGCALLWCLFRVLPKPSRAQYPCQRVAIPLASGFIGYVLAFPLALAALRKARQNLSRARYVVAAGCLAMAAGAFIAGLNSSSEEAQAAWTPTDLPNSPMGVARGIHPGRVVWAHDPGIASWDGSTGYWWDSNAVDQVRLDAMTSQSLRTLTGATNDAGAWDALFHHFNRTHRTTDVGYTAGEKIVIKINQNTARSGHALNGNSSDQKTINGNPHLIRSMLRQLVNQAGVAPSNITVYDAVRYIGDSIYLPSHGEFPQVRFMDQSGTDGREKVVWTGNVITYATNNGCGLRVPAQVTNASYVINMAIMKNHGGDGPTLNGKNHYGSIDGRDHYWISGSRGMARYNPIVDLMGHRHLGEKTVLFMIDTLYGANGADAVPTKWRMAPFNNAWPASLFVSQDNVAIDSVGFDFENAEWGVAQNSDNLLHEAALANNAPSGWPYAPNGDGRRLPSLGVHEHWNHATDKQYSRNLGGTNGLELVLAPIAPQPPASPASLIATPADTRVTLAWLPSATATNYHVKRSLVSSTNPANIADTTATTYSDIQVTNCVRYYYVVSGVNAIGEGPNSVEVSVVPNPQTNLAGPYVFNDVFSNSSLNAALPAAPTPTSTSYEIMSSKSWNPSPSLAAGHLKFGIAATTSGSIQAQALFSSVPVTLTRIGDSLSLIVTFANTSGLLTQSGALGFGLYHSGQNQPVPGGLNATATTGYSGNATGNAQTWVGYIGQLAFTGGNSQILTRPAQAGTANNNQDLVTTGSAGSSYSNPAGTTVGMASSAPSLTLTAGNAYTEVLTVTLAASNTLAITNRLYSGSGTNGTLLSQFGGSATGATWLTDAFDALAIGWRATANTSASAIDINQILVQATLNTPVSPMPTYLVGQLVDGQLQLSWPADPVGWRLQIQTNDSSHGLGTNWTDVPGTASTNQVFLPVGTNNESVFLRLIYP